MTEGVRVRNGGRIAEGSQRGNLFRRVGAVQFSFGI